MTKQSKSASRKPTHAVYQVTGKADAATWTRIGAAWPHQDGNGFNLALDAVPLHGRIVIRTITDKAPAKDADA